MLSNLHQSGDRLYIILKMESVQGGLVEMKLQSIRPAPNLASSQSEEDIPQIPIRRQVARSETDEDVEEWIHGAARPRIRRQQGYAGNYQHNFKLKFDIPNFDGKLHIEDCLDWLKSVETFFECMEIPDDKQVKLVAYKLRGGAAAWWEQLQAHRLREGKVPIRSWTRMRRLIRERFLPVDYDQILYHQYQQCQQRGRSVSEYTEEFYRLNARVDLSEPERHQVSRYLGGLKDPIRDLLSLQSIWRLSEAVNLAFKAESNLSRHPQRNSTYRRGQTEVQVEPGQLPSIPSAHQNSAGSNNPIQAQPNTSKAVDRTHPAPNRANPYARPSTIKCYRCNQPGHKSNECPRRKALLLEEEDDNQFDQEEDQEETEIVEGDEGEPLNCILEKLALFQQHSPSQRHSLFRTRCTIKKKFAMSSLTAGVVKI